MSNSGKNKSFQNIVDHIVKEKSPCFFISPHLDDAILSAGDLLAYLSDKTQVHVVNVFTSPSEKPYTISAKAFLKQCGYSDADKLFNDRIEEDTRVFSKLGIRPSYLGFIDASWRREQNISSWREFIGRFLPEFRNIYPIFRLHISNGKVSEKDKLTKENLAEKLKEIVPKNAYVFCPLADNSHVDHVLVREVCSQSFLNNVIFWSDYPYNARRLGNQKLGAGIIPYVLRWESNSILKLELIKGYKSQYMQLFRNGKASLVPEGFYMPTSSPLMNLASKKPSIMIGIPAYNEGQNISYLITNLLSQKMQTGDLEKIIVISDASTDDTVEKVKSIKDAKLVLVDKEIREGAYKAQNDIIKMADCDILVILNADIMPYNENFLEELVNPITRHPEVALSAPYTLAAKPRTFFEKILVSSHELKRNWYMNMNEGNNLYMCHGVARAFSRDFFSKIDWPMDVPEDAYSYLACIDAGYRFCLAKDSITLFRTPSKWSDHLKQSKRFFGGKEKMYKFFPPETVRKEYHIPPLVKIKHTFVHFIKKPILTISYAVLANYIKLFQPKSYQAKWDIAISTKERIKPEDASA